MFVICKNTIKGFVRNKLLYIITAIAVGLIFFSLALNQLTLNQGSKVILDFSLTIIEIFGLITTLVLGSYLLYNEINKNTILLVLSKNPSRKDFILGKFLGFGVLIGLIYLILTLASGIVFHIHNIGFQWAYFGAIFLSYIKIMITLASIIFFSTFMSPFLTLLVSVLFYIISHMTAFLRFYAFKVAELSINSIGGRLVQFVYLLFPNFQDYSMKEYLLSPFLGEYTVSHIGLSALSGVFYVLVFLFFGVIIFRKKQF